MRRPTYSEIVSTVALFIALGGTSYAVTSLPAASVGNAQLKNGAVTASKLHAKAVGAAAVVPNSLTGAQIDESSLGVVPHAAVADSAASAKSAGTADTATHATTADTAARATTADQAVSAATAVSANSALLATNADDANLLGGAAPATYKMSCPSGMVVTRDLCVELTARAADTWIHAEQTCGLALKRLPGLGEMAEAFNVLGAPQGNEWTSNAYYDGAVEVMVMSEDSGRNAAVAPTAATGSFPFRCVATPTDNG
jgi:hypothetical protein